VFIVSYRFLIGLYRCLYVSIGFYRICIGVLSVSVGCYRFIWIPIDSHIVVHRISLGVI
jgi:hypothetical protein